MALFKRGSKAPSGANSKPATGAVPRGGYGSGGAPGKAQKTTAIKSKPAGGKKGAKAHKPVGGYGARSKPGKMKVNKPMVAMGTYAADNMATPKSPIPGKSKLFNMPKGKFTY
jgi:hypothetical protein